MNEKRTKLQVKMLNLREVVKKKLQGITGLSEAEVDIVSDTHLGDYSSNVSFILARKRKKSPEKIAGKILSQLERDEKISRLFEKIEVAGGGFINFWIKREILIRNLERIVKESADYGRLFLGRGKTVIVEYSSPNIAKPFTVGHLRSTIVGDAIANLLERLGFRVLRDNHLGDWGTQFGKLIYAIKTWGDEAKIYKSKNPVRELFSLYVLFHKEAEKNKRLEVYARLWFKKLEGGDSEARRIWKKCVELSLSEFKRIYDILGIKFSKEFNNGTGLPESFFEDKIEEVVKELEEKSLLKVGEGGAKLVFFENDKYPPAMVVKSDGTSLYLTRDLATDKYRKDNFNPHLIINETGVEQSLYFKQLFEIEKMLGWFREGQRVHVAHGLYRFKDKKMSTRKGDVIWLEDVLKEGELRAKKLSQISSKRKAKNLEKLARLISVGAVKYNDLKRHPSTSCVFDWDEVLNMEGNSGPYLQYTYARGKSVLRKAQHKASRLKSAVSFFKLQLNEKEYDLLRYLYHFPDFIYDAAVDYSPNLLCTFLYNLAQKFNSFYDEVRIIGGEKQTFDLLLTQAFCQEIENGLKILGIEVPERM